MAEDVTTAPLGNFDIQRAVERALDAWKARLVSFDGNNKQIFYKPLKVGTVDFDDKFVDQDVLASLLTGKKVRTSQIYPSLIAKIDSKELQELARVGVLGLKRKTTQLLERFENYLHQAKKDIRTAGQK